MNSITRVYVKQTTIRARRELGQDAPEAAHLQDGGGRGEGPRHSGEGEAVPRDEDSRTTGDYYYCRGHAGRPHPQKSDPIRPVHLSRVSLLRVLESNFPGEPLSNSTDMRIATPEN